MVSNSEHLNEWSNDSNLGTCLSATSVPDCMHMATFMLVHSAGETMLHQISCVLAGQAIIGYLHM